MLKFRVYITGMAVVTQSHIIEAANAEEARLEALKPDTYNNAYWEKNGTGVEDHTVEVEYVDVCE